jgi:putative colanic acid biosynthesis acetyltransferase WcaF
MERIEMINTDRLPVPDPLPRGQVRLRDYRNPPNLDKGAGFIVRAIWHIVNILVIQNQLIVSSKVKVAVLRLFGARIGARAIIKPAVNIKSPWFLKMGDDVWLGERCWIDSLALVEVGNNVCLSQDVYLCCGNHDWTSPTFDKSVRSIIIEDGCWIASRATVMGGVTLGTHSVVGAMCLIAKSTEPYGIYSGVPAQKVRMRNVRS